MADSADPGSVLVWNPVTLASQSNNCLQTRDCIVRITTDYTDWTKGFTLAVLFSEKSPIKLTG